MMLMQLLAHLPGWITQSEVLANAVPTQEAINEYAIGKALALMRETVTRMNEAEIVDEF